MVYMHFGPDMTLRAFVPAAGTACGDVFLGVPQHPIPAEAVLSLALVLSIPWCPAAGTSFHSLRIFLPELPGDHQKPLLSLLPRLSPEDFVVIQ